MTTEVNEHDEAQPKRRGGPFSFFREVRAEARKVTWATRQEVTVSAIMVLVMVALASLFFFLIDLIVGNIVNFALGINS